MSHPHHVHEGATVRRLDHIAREIAKDWSNQGKGVNHAARPYLEAMLLLDSIDGNYYEDSARSVVAYFLANAQSWRGDVAKRLKAELNAMLKTPAKKERIAS